MFSSLIPEFMLLCYNSLLRNYGSDLCTLNFKLHFNGEQVFWTLHSGVAHGLSRGDMQMFFKIEFAVSM